MNCTPIVEELLLVLEGLGPAELPEEDEVEGGGEDVAVAHRDLWLALEAPLQSQHRPPLASVISARDMKRAYISVHSVWFLEGQALESIPYFGRLEATKAEATPTLCMFVSMRKLGWYQNLQGASYKTYCV